MNGKRGIAILAAVLVIGGALFLFLSRTPTQGIETEGTYVGAENGTTQEDSSLKDTQLAILGGGCFWCMEAVYEPIEGVVSVVSGYAGGTTADPTYEEVCTGRTGHAEVVRIEYDPDIISYEKILDIFWHAHDPTTLNQQGADVGTQYRSIILYRNEEQKKIAEKSLASEDTSGDFDDPIVTEIKPLEKFYPAEEYHQDYYAKNPYAAYCSFVIRPKLRKLGLE
jgi:peptide-methionine (S)-S-oxide reductase